MMVSTKVVITKKPNGELVAVEVPSEKKRDLFMKYVPKYIRDMEEAKKHNSELAKVHEQEDEDMEEEDEEKEEKSFKLQKEFTQEDDFEGEIKKLVQKKF